MGIVFNPGRLCISGRPICGPLKGYDNVVVMGNTDKNQEDNYQTAAALATEFAESLAELDHDGTYGLAVLVRVGGVTVQKNVAGGVSYPQA